MKRPAFRRHVSLAEVVSKYQKPRRLEAKLVENTMVDRPKFIRIGKSLSKEQRAIYASCISEGATTIAEESDEECEYTEIKRKLSAFFKPKRINLKLRTPNSRSIPNSIAVFKDQKLQFFDLIKHN